MSYRFPKIVVKFQLMADGATGAPGLIVASVLVNTREVEAVPTQHLVDLDLVTAHHQLRIHRSDSALIAKVGL